MEFIIYPSEKYAAVPPSVMLYYNPFSYAYIMCLMHYYLVPILVLTVDGYFLINLLSVPVTNICQSQSLLCVMLTTILFHMHNMCLMHLLCVPILVTI
jgi:hypothetical protein